jgi:hypothetical protein
VQSSVIWYLLIGQSVVFVADISRHAWNAIRQLVDTSTVHNNEVLVTLIRSLVMEVDVVTPLHCCANTSTDHRLHVVHRRSCNYQSAAAGPGNLWPTSSSLQQLASLSLRQVVVGTFSTYRTQFQSTWHETITLQILYEILHNCRYMQPERRFQFIHSPHDNMRYLRPLNTAKSV